MHNKTKVITLQRSAKFNWALILRFNRYLLFHSQALLKFHVFPANGNINNNLSMFNITFNYEIHIIIEIKTRWQRFMVHIHYPLNSDVYSNLCFRTYNNPNRCVNIYLISLLNDVQAFNKDIKCWTYIIWRVAKQRWRNQYT